MTIKNVRLGCVIAGGLLLGLSGCGSSGGGFGDNSVRSTPIIIPNKTNNQNQTTPNRNQNSQNNQNTAQNPNNRDNLATSALNMNNFGFSTPVANKAPLNVPRPPAQLAQEVQKVLDGTNRLRAQKGLKPLKLDPNLSAYAQVRASEIAIQFNHRRLDGRNFFDTLTEYQYTAENIFGGSSDGNTAVKWWHNSPSHFKNITNQTLETIGIGIIYDPNSTYKYYWVQVFATEGTKIPYQFIDNTTTNPKPLDQVVINGTAIPLTQLNKQGQWQQIATNGNQGWVNGYQHTRFGVITPQGANASHLYYQGQRTSDVAIPKSGTATYNGTALVVKGSQVNTDVKSQFTANFGTRKLDGKLTQNNATLYNISADINGSGFASKKDAPIQTQGAFFGQNAQELAGVFKDTKTDTKGVFGAKK